MGLLVAVPFCADLMFQLPDRSGSVSITSCWGSWTTGSAARRTPFHRLKIAVLAPMPSASVMTATTVKPRFFRNHRRA